VRDGPDDEDVADELDAEAVLDVDEEPDALSELEPPQPVRMAACVPTMSKARREMGAGVIKVFGSVA